jgi:murein DD-endopeptidase MepM/ murein hydrolase activator NlpD
LSYASRCLGLALTAAVIAAPTAIAQETGGVSAPDRAAVSAVRCSGGTWSCGAGEPMVVRGAALAGVTKVVFLGRAGRVDDRAVTRVAHDGDGALTVQVPVGARTGPLRLVTPGVGTAKTRRAVRVGPVRRSAPVQAPERDVTAGEPLVAGSRSALRLTYDVSAPAKVEAANVDTASVVRTFDVAAGAGSVAWDGTSADGMPVAPGRYVLRLAAGAPTAQAAQATQPTEVQDAIFPIAGKHDLGQTDTNDFGGARNHGGQDMFAKCGTPLVAVRPAVVQFAATQDRAGNYVVLQDASGQSYAYMHMRDPSLVAKGTKVRAGQRVGYVGETGRASGCHLHFELWTAPGWYEGGKAIDPLPELRRWDAFS